AVRPASPPPTTVISCIVDASCGPEAPDNTRQLALRTVPVMATVEGPVELLIAVDRADARPLHEQLEQALRAAIRSGRLPAGSRLPSSRSLSAQLGISRGVVSWAYGQLAAE